MAIGITVIIPAYNAEATIERCVVSVANQSWSSLEIIVVDDGSDDATSTVLEGLSHSIEELKVVHQQNRGRSAARNAGMRLASNDWICFVDADDWLYPDALSSLADGIFSAEVCSVWGGFRSSVGAMCLTTTPCLVEREGMVRRIVNCEGEVYALNGDRLNNSPLFERTIWGKLYRLSAYGGARFPLFVDGLRHGEDALFNIGFYAGSKGTISIIPSIVYHYDDESPGTIRQFTQKDADTLLPFAEASFSFIMSSNEQLIKQGAEPFSVDEIKGFVGRQVTGIFIRARNLCSSASIASDILCPILSHSLIADCWGHTNGAELSGIRKSLCGIEAYLAKRGFAKQVLKIEIGINRVKRRLFNVK